MDKNQKLIIVITMFASCLGVSSMASSYNFTKSASYSTSGTVDVKDRTYEITDIILSAGYSDASCTVNGLQGQTLSNDEIENFFVEDKDVTDSYDNHFVKLKRYYVSMSQASNGVMTYKLSTTKKDSSYFVCPYFYDKDGNEIEYAYYGKYKGSISGEKLCSKSGSSLTATYNTTLDSFRNYAKANGDQYHQTDWCTVFTAQIIFMCMYKTTQASNFMEYRSSGSNTILGNGDKYLGIEDIVGNGYECVDGMVVRSGTTLDACSISWANKISDYKSNLTTNQSYLIGATKTTAYISKKYYSEGKPILSLFPKEMNGSTDGTTYYCDCFTFNSSYSPNSTFWGAFSKAYSSNGLFCLASHSNWDLSSAVITSRLHAKKLN